MKHAIPRYPEVAQNQDFVNLLVATMNGNTEFPSVLREITVDNHRAGTISAYLHSTMEKEYQYQIVAQSPPAAQAIQARTGLFCESQELALPYPNLVHTTFGLNLPEDYLDDDLLQLTICTLLNYSSRALMVTAGILGNSDKAITASVRKYRTISQLTDLLEPTHSFITKSDSMPVRNLVMVWFK